MSETKNHPWCRDVRRDEAVRAAEDAAAAARTPVPDHRDLPAAVAELRERVARLTTKHNALADLARLDAGWVKTKEDCLTAERDAAIRERDALRAKLEQTVIQRTTNANLHSVIRERDQQIVALKSRLAYLESAPAANAGGEANQPWPMAFAVWGRGAVCGVTVSREDAGAMQREFAFDTEVMPLYAAPQPPRGWLTKEERGALERAFDLLCDDDGDNPLAGTVQKLLARSTPPRVRRPGHRGNAKTLLGIEVDCDNAWIAAIREAGGEVEE